MQTDFLHVDAPPRPRRRAPKMERQPHGQYFLPAWAGEILFDRTFGHLPAGSRFYEPMCGDGRMLAAIPDRYEAVGCDIDPIQVERARQRTGRPVLCGDFEEVELPGPIDGVFGNPDFHVHLLDRLLNYAADLLREDSTCALVLAQYLVKTPKHVLRWNRHFTISQAAIPQSLFPFLKHPLIFARFVRSSRPILVGFELYRELNEIRQISPEYQDMLTREIDGPRSVWRLAVRKAIAESGGDAHLSEIYARIAPRVPTATAFWKEQVRKVVHDDRYFGRLERGRYSNLPARN